jgi:ABC-type glycerol-3-phosphate transport system substrate-binding protein
MKRITTTPAVVLVAALAASLALCACGRGAAGGAATATVDRDTLTRRQKDSIVSTMPLPGARGIGSAQKAVDKLNAHAAAVDSVR